jgi:hypothetical protein
VMILVGKKNPTRLADADRLHALFAGMRPGQSDQKPDDRTLWYGPLDTTLQGVKMLDDDALGVPPLIAKVIRSRTIDNVEAKNYGWKERKFPHQR